jgi:hypothetical protein
VLAIFIILICPISLTLHKVMDMTIHNQYPDIELTSPVYFYNCGTYNEYPVERTDDSAMMKIEFRFDLGQYESRGILMYEVRKKGNEVSNHQSDIDIMHVKLTEKVSKMMRLLVTWKVERLKKPSVHIMLIEHNNNLVLNEDKLAKLYDKINDRSSRYDNPSRCAWLICNNAALVATCKATGKNCPKLNINISKEDKNKYTKKPMWVNQKGKYHFLMT